MKTIKYLACFFLLFSFQQLLSQNWFPLEVGNKWQYINIEYGGNFTVPDTTYYYNTISYDEVLNDALINNNTYFNFSQNPQNWFRFAETEQKIFYRCENEDKLIMDFNLQTDSFFISYLPAPANQEVFAMIISGDYWLFDTLFNYKGYLWTIAVDGYTGQSVKYIPNYGMISDSFYYYDNVSLGYTIKMRKLIQSKTSGKNFRGSEAPVILFDPIYSIQDSIFSLDIVVHHLYNTIFPAGSPLTSFNFVDSVLMHSYYSKDDSIIHNPSTYSFNITGTDIWEVNKLLNMDLMSGGFQFCYKIEAIDKGMDPHISFAPDSGYFIAVYDTTSGIISIENQQTTFNLSQNYPNPFNPTTKIKFHIPTSPLNPSPYKGEGNRERFVTLKVYDILGNEITTLVNEEKTAGTYEIEFNAISHSGGVRNLTSGIYFYQLKVYPANSGAEGYVETRKMLLLK